jgi:hypothetical protein
MHYSGADPGGRGAHPARPPPIIGKNMIFWLKNRDFSHEIPPQFSRLPSLGAIFLSAPPPPNLKSWIRPCYFMLFCSDFQSEFSIIGSPLAIYLKLISAFSWLWYPLPGDSFSCNISTSSALLVIFRSFFNFFSEDQHFLLHPWYMSCIEFALRQHTLNQGWCVRITVQLVLW